MKDKRSRFGGVSKTYICPVCGKVFLVPFQSKGGGHTQWVFRKRVKNRFVYMCSYSCFNVSIEMRREAK